MAKMKHKNKKPRDQKAKQLFSFKNVRQSLLFLAFVSLFLFYPGDSYYFNLFSRNKAAFDAVEKQQNRQFVVHPQPYVLQPTILPELTGQAVFVIDLASKATVYKRNEHSQMYPASTTKVITALTAIDAFKPTDILEVKRVIEEGQTAELLLGERLTFENILYAVLVHSGNDAAYVVADNYPGGYDAFITAMNEKAMEIGMTQSRFLNPAGLDEEGQMTTAYDLALAGRKLLENEELAKIVSTKSITISDVDFLYTHVLYSTNILLGSIPGVGGLKTGKTDLAGENLITFYKKNGHQYLIVILHSEDRFKDTENLVKWIDTNVGFL